MSVKKNIFYSTLLSVSNVVFPFITAPYVSRVLGVENIGVVNFATVYAAYYLMVATLGIPTHGIREIARLKHDAEGRNQLFSELFSLTCLTALICSAVYVVTVFSIPELRRNSEFLMLSGLSVLLLPFNVDWFFVGREQFKMVTMRSLASKVICVGGMFIFVRTRDDAIPYMVLTTVAAWLGHYWNFASMLRKEVKIKFKNLHLKQHLKKIFILFSSSAAISLYTMMGTLLLGFLASDAEVGYFSTADRVCRMVFPIVTAGAGVVMVRIAAVKDTDERQIYALLNRSFGHMMMLAVPAVTGLICLAPRFVPFFFGIEFQPASFLLQLLALQIIFMGLNNLYGPQILLGMGHDRKFTAIACCGAISGLSTNILLIPSMGAVGAAIAAIMAEIATTIAGIILSQRVLRFRPRFSSIWQPVLASIPIVLGISLFNRFINSDIPFLLASIAFGVIAYFALMVFVLKNENAQQVYEPIIRRLLPKQDSIE